MPSKIILLTGNSLCNNPRVQKEAAALAEAGYQVEVLGAWLDDELAGRDRMLASGQAYRFTPVIDLTQPRIGGEIRRQVYRLRNRASRLAYRYGGAANRWQLGPAVDALFRAALSRAADLYIGHSEGGLFVARRLLDAGRNVGVDMEDWYAEDLPEQARNQRPIALLRELEAALLTNCVHATSPSRAMSTALAQHYGCREPAAIYNAFPLGDRDRMDRRRRDRGDSSLPSIHWVSQTIGPCRGLEDLFRALPLVKCDAEVHLRGRAARGAEKWLADSTPQKWRGRIFVHAPVSNGELLSRIAEHDIGLALEIPYCRSRDLTVTNKCLHYLLGGLAVVASDTAGQREVGEKVPGALSLYPSGDAAMLAQCLNRLLGSADELHRAKAAALRGAERAFCWERQQTALLESVARALEARPNGIMAQPPNS